MMKLEQAARQALEALNSAIGYGLYQDDNWLDADIKNAEKAITALREALDHSGEATEMVEPTVKDSLTAQDHFRDATKKVAEPFDMDDHPPHRLCECRKCMEYFTPLPDCDAFAGGGKPIAEQTNTQLMEGYRIGLAEMREKCAKVCDDKHDYMCSKAAKAIRAIKFEGDTGFRPVSEMVAEQADGKHWSPDDMAYRPGGLSMEQAKQEPVAEVILRNQTIGFGRTEERKDIQFLADVEVGTKLYAAPVRTKDLTDDELMNVWVHTIGKHPIMQFARAVIAAYKEKNKC